jgi:hypothetical protein
MYHTRYVWVMKPRNPGRITNNNRCGVYYTVTVCDKEMCMKYDAICRPRRSCGHAVFEVDGVILTSKPNMMLKRFPMWHI